LEAGWWFAEMYGMSRPDGILRYAAKRCVTNMEKALTEVMKPQKQPKVTISTHLARDRY
jgi:hypothetical protein